VKFSEKLAAACLALGAFLSLVAIANHPQAGPPAPAIFQTITGLASMDRLVHTVLIVILVAQLFGFIVLSQKFGSRRPAPIAALAVYALGTAATIAAACTDGYMIPAIAARYANGSSGDLQSAMQLLTLCGLIVQVATRVGLNAMFVAFALWSIEFMHVPGWVRTTGIVGLIGSAGSLVLLAATGRFEPHNLLLITLTQALWIFGAAAILAFPVRAGVPDTAADQSARYASD